MDMRITREVDVCLFNGILDYGQLLQEKNVMGSFGLLYFLGGESEV